MLPIDQLDFFKHSFKSLLHQKDQCLWVYTVVDWGNQEKEGLSGSAGH